MAGNASSNSGYYPIYTTGYDPYPFSSGGTSAVAPLYAGLFTVINAAIGARVGFINPILYALGNKVCSDVNPAIVGGPSDNGFNGTMGYPAGASWDACTGWGSINGNALLSALASSSWVDNDLTESPMGRPPQAAAHLPRTRKTTAASTSISLTPTGTFTSCTGVIRQPSGWTTT